MRDLLAGPLVSADLGLIDQPGLRKLYEGYCSNGKSWIGVKDIFVPLALESWARNYKEYLTAA